MPTKKDSSFARPLHTTPQSIKYVSDSDFSDDGYRGPQHTQLLLPACPERGTLCRILHLAGVASVCPTEEPSKTERVEVQTILDRILSTEMLVRSLALLWALGPAVVHAALPLITDDTGTQGRGNFQLELTQEQSLLRQAGADQQMTVTSAVLSYGAVDSIDLILSIPYLRLGDSPDSGTSGAGGAGDANLDIKWRFYVDHAFSLSFKSGVSFSNGDETRGLGTGRVGWSNYLTATYEAAPWALHTHVGYRRRNNVLGERVDLWHASAAIVRQMGNSLKLIADAGIDTRTDPGANSDPLFLVGGLIWSLHKNFDIDAGYKLESSDTLRARTLLAGVAFRW